MPTEARGAARRREILEATVRVIGRGGVEAVEHRAVAAEAGVPLGSTTYYFESKADMVAQALHHVADRETERVEEQVQVLRGEDPDGLPARLVEWAMEQAFADRLALLAQYELYLEGARREDLRPAAERWDRAWHTLLEAALERLGTPDAGRRAQLLCAGVDGLILQFLATGRDIEELRPLLLELIERLSAP